MEIHRIRPMEPLWVSGGKHESTTGIHDMHFIRAASLEMLELFLGVEETAIKSSWAKDSKEKDETPEPS